MVCLNVVKVQSISKMVLSLRPTPGENLSNTLVNGGTEKVKTTDTEQKMGRGGRMQKMGRDEMDQYSLFMHFLCMVAATNCNHPASGKRAVAFSSVYRSKLHSSV